jgi:hypothetical protein
MRLQCDEALVFDAASNVRYTSDGYLIATPRVARTGIQQYYGYEIGLQGDDAKRVINVYRPEAEVFKQAALATLVSKPVTRGHPDKPVDTKTWKDFAVGMVGNDILRDGEFIRIPMALMDAQAIQDFKDGTRQLSLGYTCDVDMVSGVTPEGVKYDAMQKNIKINHVAQVDKARGGSRLAIGDAAPQAVADAAYEKRNERLTNAWRDGLDDNKPAQPPRTITSHDVEKAIDSRNARLETAWKGRDNK